MFKKFGIVISKKDEAGMCISSELDKLGLKYVLVDDETIYEDGVDEIDELVGVDFIIFATKHESEKETKTLSVHAPGNWRGAQYGGVAEKVCKTSGLFLEKSEEEVKKVVIDWKGCGISSERQKIIDLLSEIGLDVLRSDEISR
jgi:D-tyrosyl-tRNA(Tyr) deacylase